MKPLGSLTPPYTAIQSALVYDAILAGLAMDVADEGPMAWLKPMVRAQAPQPHMVEPETPMPPVLAQRGMAIKPEPRPEPPISVPVFTAPEAALRLWKDGEAGGVAVVLGAEAAPQGPALALLKAMLAAVGLGHAPLGFVGVAGGIPKGGLEVAKKDEFINLLAALQPRQTLLLGQGVLFALQGKPMGVEGWQAAPQTMGLTGVVGVTYPLDLLLAKPLFKGLAWQHLQRWQAGFVSQETPPHA